MYTTYKITTAIYVCIIYGSFIQLLTKQLLEMYYMLATIIGSENAAKY